MFSESSRKKRKRKNPEKGKMMDGMVLGSGMMKKKLVMEKTRTTQLKVAAMRKVLRNNVLPKE